MNTYPFPTPKKDLDKVTLEVNEELARTKIDLALIRYQLLLEKGMQWTLVLPKETAKKAGN